MNRLNASALVLCVLALSAAAVMAGFASGGPMVLAVRADPPPFDIRGTGSPPVAGSEVGAPAGELPPGFPSAPHGASAGGGTGGDAGPGKFLLPMGDVRFAGERSSRSWSIFLTADEASAARGLQFAYINAVSVMPEVSRINVLVNDRVVLNTPVASPGGYRTVEVPLAAGSLRPGANTVAIEVEMRHRVVCSVDGTYELWADISAARTGLTFGRGVRPSAMRSLDDITATGFDEHGRTTLSVVIPRVLDTSMEERLLHLSQALAVRGRFIHPVVALPDRLPQGSRPGELVVMMVPDSHLPEGIDAPGSDTRPVVDFIDLPDGSSALLVSGPTLEDIDRGIESIVPPTLLDRERAPTMDTASFHHPETPFIRDRSDLTLATLGVESQEFSGRRFSAGFTIGLPADFYAEAYAEARFLIDAGFAVDMLPGSYFSVSINGQVASVLPLDADAGDMLTQMPIRVPMRHFHPGVNIVELTGVFDTATDAACAPGTTLSDKPRFALFDTSRFIIPRFARMGTSPNLAAFSARGFPHWDSADVLSVYLTDQDRGTVAAAATLLARVAFGAQRVLPVDIVPHINAIQQQDALLIGASDQLPLIALSRTGLARDLRSFWANPELDSAPAGRAGAAFGADLVQAGERPDPDEVRERWQQAGRGDADGAQLRGGFHSWLSRTFDLTVDAILPRLREAPYSPPNGTLLVLAQGGSPLGEHVWTVVTAGSATALDHAIGELTRPEPWSRVQGRITAFRHASHAVDVVMPGWVDFIPTQETNLFNLRMVAANWLSGNLAIYAIGLLVAGLLLGIGTYAFLIQLGRR